MKKVEWKNKRKGNFQAGKNLREAGYPTWTGKYRRGRENFPGGILFWRGKGMAPYTHPPHTHTHTDTNTQCGAHSDLQAQAWHLSKNLLAHSVQCMYTGQQHGEAFFVGVKSSLAVSLRRRKITGGPGSHDGMELMHLALQLCQVRRLGKMNFRSFSMA